MPPKQMTVNGVEIAYLDRGNGCSALSAALNGLRSSGSASQC